MFTQTGDSMLPLVYPPHFPASNQNLRQHTKIINSTDRWAMMTFPDLRFSRHLSNPINSPGLSFRKFRQASDTNYRNTKTIHGSLKTEGHAAVVDYHHHPPWLTWRGKTRAP